MRRHGTHDTLKKAREGIRTQKGIFKKEGGPKRIFFWGAAIRRSPKTKTKEKEKGKSMGRSHMAQPGEKIRAAMVTRKDLYLFKKFRGAIKVVFLGGAAT